MHERLIMAFVKTFFMNLCIAFSFLKIKGCKKIDKRNIIIIIFVNVIVGILYAIIHENANIPLPQIFMNLICYTVYLLIVVLLIDEMDKSFFVSMLISIFLSFFFILLSASIVYLITSLQLFKNLINSVSEYITIGVIQFIIIFYFFKIKRFKDGFSFIKEENSSRKINIISIVLSNIIIIFIMFIISTDYWIHDLTYWIIIFGMLLILYLIKENITNHYKTKMKDRTVEMLTEQIKEKDKIIDDLRVELNTTLKINHKYSHRISAAEKAISKLKFNEEFASENNEIIELINELSKNYKNEILKIEKKDDNLPKTEVFEIDNMLEYMNNEAKKNNISFKVEVKCNVKDITENIINKSKLETLLADHINDAIIAIKHSNNNISHNINVEFNNIDNVYQIKIYDTGIEFEIETLLKLGQEQITTHKDNGGSGIGFMTTFETLKECKGSLIIEEYNQEQENYTKAIIIKFDNKNQYKIHSYRADGIRKKSEEDRIIIENL